MDVAAGDVGVAAGGGGPRPQSKGVVRFMERISFW
jgi:hypothetical protein